MKTFEDFESADKWIWNNIPGDEYPLALNALMLSGAYKTNGGVLLLIDEQGLLD